MPMGTPIAGVPVHGTGNVAVVHPTPNAAGDLMLYFWGVKPYTLTPTVGVATPLGVKGTGGTVAAGNGAGSTAAGVSQQSLISSGPSNATISALSPSPLTGIIVRVAKDVTDRWKLLGFSGGDTNSTTTAVSAQASNGHAAGDIVAGDRLIVFVHFGDDVPTHSAQAVSVPGCTVGAWQALANAGTTTGNDARFYLGYVDVLTGVSTAAPTYTATASATGVGSLSAVAIARVRATPASPPTASFSASATTVELGGTITFTDTSTGNPPVNGWNWDFGHFSNEPPASSDQGPWVVTFNQPGESLVQLTVYNDDGVGYATPLSIMVTEPGGGTVNVNGAATATLTGSFASTGRVGKAGAASATLTGSFSGTGRVGKAANAALTLTGTLAATGRVGAVGGASVALTGSFAATGQVDAPALNVNGSAATTLTGSFTATGIATSPTLPVTDSFNRADSPRLGGAESGQAWIQVLGTTGIVSNKAQHTATELVSGYNSAIALVDAGVSNVTVSATFGSNQNMHYEAMRVRQSAPDTYYRVQHQNNASMGYLIRNTAAGETVIANGAWCPPSAHVHTLTAREESGATRLVLTIDGVERYNALDTSSGRPMGTQHGMGLQVETAATFVPVSFDDFSIAAEAVVATGTASATLTGSFSATGRVGKVANAALTLTGSFSSAGLAEVVIVGYNGAASATLTGSFSTGAVVGKAGNAALTLTGSMAATSRVGSSAPANNLTATGSFAAGGGVGVSSSASLTMAATFAATARVGKVGTAALNLTGSFSSSTAVIVAGGSNAEVMLAGTFAATSVVGKSANAALTLNATFATTGQVGKRGAATLTATGTFAADSRIGKVATAQTTLLGDFDATHTLGTRTGTTLEATAEFETSGAVGMSSDAELAMEATFNAEGMVSLTPPVKIFVGATRAVEVRVGANLSPRGYYGSTKIYGS